MSPKPLAVFRSDLPDDFIINDGRELVQIGGRNVTEEIRALVLKLGCDASAVIDGGKRGWGLSIHYKGEGLWLHIRSYYPAYYLVLARPHWSGSLTRDPTYAELWKALNAALRQDPQFHDLQWYDSFEEAPPPPDEWFGWAHGLRKPPGFLARYVARPLGWLTLVLAAFAFLDFVSPAPLTGLAYLLASALLLTIGYKVSHLFGVRLPWVRLP
jgi:hypothetical protein